MATGTETKIIPNTKTANYRKRSEALRTELSRYIPQYIDLRDHLLPCAGRYLDGAEGNQDNNGSKKYDNIINGTPGDALRTCAAGLHGGLTSSSEEWFDLKLANRAWLNSSTVRLWLDEVKQRMLMVFARSNFYGAMHSLYYELCVFGTAVMLIDGDPDTVIRCRPLTVGEYTLIIDSSYRPSGLHRRFSMTAEQIVEKFEPENIPEEVKRAMQNQQPDERFEIEHVIERNREYDPKKVFTSNGKPWKSVYYCRDAGDQDQVLEEKGYHSQPFIVLRWQVHGVDTYGDSCPGMAALGDVKQLQRMEIDKLDALSKMVKPPMNAPTSMQNTGGNILPGGVNFIDVQAGGQGFSPAFQVKPDVQSLSMEGDRVQKRIENCFFNDLFLSLLNETKRMTAKEVAERSSEKLMVLGPVLEQIQADGLDIIIDRVFALMDEAMLIPQAPPELPPGTPLLVDYISKLAQAQKIVGLTAIEQFTQYVGSVAVISPGSLAKVDFDSAIEQYGARLTVPPSLIKSNEDADAIRQQQAQQQQRLATAQNSLNVAKTAQTLSQTPMGDGTALDAAMQSIRQQNGVNPQPPNK